jgi:hypothetical protein
MHDVSLLVVVVDIPHMVCECALIEKYCGKCVRQLPVSLRCVMNVADPHPKFLELLVGIHFDVQ